MNIELIDIKPLPKELSSTTLRPPRQKNYTYTAIAIEEDGKYYYWAKGVSIEIEKYEYELVKANPKLYYFSTSLKLHLKIMSALQKTID